MTFPDLKLLTKREAAELVGVCERTIDNWRQCGLRVMKLAGIVRIDPNDLLRFIEQHKAG